MNVLLRRRLLRTAMVLVAIVAVWYGMRTGWLQFSHPAYFSGWLLLAVMLVLLLFNARKKFPYLPLGSARAWAQWHYYLGLFLFLLFFLHVPWRLPNGGFEIMLFVFFLLEVLSGVVGLYLSRQLPRIMNKRGEPVLYDRIAGFRHQLRERIETQVADSVERLRSTAIAKFYHEQLMAYLLKPRHYWSHVVDLPAPYKHWEHQFTSLHRYLDDAEIQMLAEIKRLFFKKIDLDLQYAGQSLLRAWLFFHIPLGYVLLLLVLVHLLLTYSFSGIP